ncbi:LPS export ABC transporter periplasmic protein LptC [Gilvimarinus sp. F26214L]|uniref:LPS export ABC transporter periplasmic protein LptC n=1 Tax=Gilvimarinus sp. DZF01 TaxID=3461371 RepID=UPI0040463D76
MAEADAGNPRKPGLPRHWLTIAAVLGLIAVSVLLLDSPPEVFQPDATLAGPPDVQMTGYLTGVRTVQYNAAGEVEYRFTTDRMSHFQPAGETDSEAAYTAIEAPFFTFYPGGTAPWYTSARQGRSSANGDLVLLQEDVRVWQEGPAGPTVITTSELLIHPQTQVAETDQFVIMTNPRSVARGTGMRADLEQENFAILSEGSTIYEPNP